MGDDTPAKPQTAIGIKLGERTLAFTGWHAIAFAGFVVAVLLALLVVFPGMRSPLWISGAMWIGMTIYWSAAASRTGPIASSESAASRARHQLLLNLALLLAFVRFPFTGYRWLPRSPWVVPAGLALHAGSIVLDVLAMRCLGRNWSGAVTIKVDHELVKTGPYRFLRHPIYVAMIGMYLGTAMVSGELHGLLGLALAVIAYARKIRMEERGLRETFGTAYDDYTRSRPV